MEIKHHKKISLKNHQEINELTIHDNISADPSILGLGQLRLLDRERVQPRAGRLDILLQDDEAGKRYEVEVQLGKVDESHIIRTIEYWDIERRRYPQYDHAAVIVAEDITTRFLNVIGLFNGFIPLIALQMSLIEIGGQASLIFTKVLDETPLGPIDDDGPEEAVDRSFWEQKVGPRSVKLLEDLLEIVRTIDSDILLAFRKSRVRVTKNEQTKRFIRLFPKKNHLRLAISLTRSNTIDEQLQEAGFDLDYNTKLGIYRFNLTKSDLDANEDFLLEFLKQAYEEEDA